jgi:hypothetical protein
MIDSESAARQRSLYTEAYDIRIWNKVDVGDIPVGEEEGCPQLLNAIGALDHSRSQPATSALPGPSKGR